MIRFISVETTIEIHDVLIESYGGAKGIRDYGLLLSALEMPKASFDGKDLHPKLFDKAAGLSLPCCKKPSFYCLSCCSDGFTFLSFGGTAVRSIP